MRDRIRATTSYAPDPDMDLALARARTVPDRATRTLLADIGTALCSVSPTLVMREVTRLAYAGRAASDVHGFGTPHAVATTGLLLRHMPRVDTLTGEAAPLTRAEYGMRLLKKAGS
ncbi:hypothetical protein ACWD7Y_05215 [Streptomyces drozdowiczii]